MSCALPAVTTIDSRRSCLNPLHIKKVNKYILRIIGAPEGGILLKPNVQATLPGVHRCPNYYPFRVDDCFCLGPSLKTQTTFYQAGEQVPMLTPRKDLRFIHSPH